MKSDARMDWWRWAWACAVLLGLGACGPRPPIRIGFLGGLSDRASTYSEDGRNGVMLYIEQRNQSDDRAERRLELIVQDHGVDLGKASASFQALVDAGVVAVIGPYSSAMAAAVLPLANETRMLMLSPTAAAVSLAGQDDYLVRLTRTTRDSARSYAQLLHARGHLRAALAKDMRNAVFSTAWADDFRAAFADLGGAVVAEAAFGMDAAASFEPVVRTLLAQRPDVLLFVANATDAARLAQQAAKRAPAVSLAAVDWAASPALVELGGHAVEGMLVAQTYKPDDDAPRYRSFQAAYLARFGRLPSSSAIASYDAMTVLATALHRARVRANETATPKECVLAYGPYEGLQQTIRFDRFGDTERASYFTVVRNGRFELLP